MPPQLGVIVEALHPRVVYTLETVLEDFLGIRVCILQEGQQNAIDALGKRGTPMVGYLRFPNNPDFKTFPCNGLVYEDHLRPVDETIHWYVLDSGWLLDEDCLGRIFYAISQYGLLRPGLNPTRDSHARYPDGDGELVVHEWLQRISDALEPHVPHAERNPPPFDYEITIDVDHPWKYRNKPFGVQLGGLVKDVALGREVGKRLGTFLGGKDPFDVLATVRAMCPAEKTKVFFLVGGTHPHDSRFNLSMPAYQRLVQEWIAAGFDIGLHPSYQAGMDSQLMTDEKHALEAIVGPVWLSRQHYLRYRLPETFRQLADMGIQREYTLCLSGKPGAPTGVALPYRWFDLIANEATEMVMVPAMVMDRTLQQYMGLSPHQAQATITEWIAKIKAVSGRFVIILHNETFSESGEWKGWRSVIQHTLAQLKQ